MSIKVLLKDLSVGEKQKIVKELQWNAYILL